MALSKIRVGKAPGLDSVLPAMANKACIANPNYIKLLYNDCLRQRWSPADWKIAKLKIMLKSSDKVRSDVRNLMSPHLSSACNSKDVERSAGRVPRILHTAKDAWYQKCYRALY